MTRIAINGLGRIGRTFMKLALENPALEIVAANDISDPDSLAYLINLRLGVRQVPRLGQSRARQRRGLVAGRRASPATLR